MLSSNRPLITLNQAANMDNFDGYQGKDNKDIFENNNRISCFDSDGIDLNSDTSKNISNDTESHEKPTYTHDTISVAAKSSKKKRGSEGKAYKKPGRKPITSEPSTKRKAQNRAAQRAFRERREKYQKDLEIKVFNLQMISESINNENKVLHERMEKVLVELEECRSRLLLSEGADFTLLGSNNPFNVILNRDSQIFHHNPSELSIDFDLSKFSCPQDQAEYMDEIKKEAVAYRIKPIHCSHNIKKNNLDQSLVIKAPQKGLTQTQSQPIETKSSSLSNRYISQIPEIGNYDNMKFDPISSNRSNSKINIKNPNRQSPGAGFTNSSISHEHEISPSSSFASMSDHNNLFQLPLEINVQSEFGKKLSESSLKTIGEENLSVCPREFPYQELHLSNKDVTYTTQHNNLL